MYFLYYNFLVVTLYILYGFLFETTYWYIYGLGMYSPTSISKEISKIIGRSTDKQTSIKDIFPNKSSF